MCIFIYASINRKSVNLQRLENTVHYLAYLAEYWLQLLSQQYKIRSSEIGLTNNLISWTEAVLFFHYYFQD